MIRHDVYCNDIKIFNLGILLPDDVDILLPNDEKKEYARREEAV